MRLIIVWFGNDLNEKNIVDTWMAHNLRLSYPVEFTYLLNIKHIYPPSDFVQFFHCLHSDYTCEAALKKIISNESAGLATIPRHLH